MKKFLCIVLSVVLVTGITMGTNCCAFSNEAGSFSDSVNSLVESACGENCYYTIDSESGTLTVSGSGNMYNYNYSDKISPFSEIKGISKIIIEDGVTSIGKHAFEGCTETESVTLPKQLKIINKYAFKDCTALKVIKIPDSVKTIGEGAFSGCTNLSKAVFGKNVNCIGKNAFFGCKSLKTVKLNKKLKKILPFAFFNCRNVRKVYVPKSVKKIGSGAFGMYGKGKGKKYKLCRVKKFVITSGGSAAAKQYAKDYGFKYKKVKGV